MDASYLRVKKWADKQHYRDRMPPWIKLYNTIIGGDSDFGFLPEIEQWQLVRIWLIASRSSSFTLDQDGNRVPVVPADELALRRSIQTTKKIPLAKFVRDGWLIPVAEHDLVLANDASAGASTDASALLGLEVSEVHKELSDALTNSVTAREQHHLEESGEHDLREAAA